ncbi:hypothetical protein VIGAN_09182500 [Vigna angularis var. angularis]|uniref:Uncharacterized protein n=1 Tax=Vigna angularis var. angularis TaxID=157739 RepID=A0A0S3SZ64_PHAAN|nr:hypothetical protein VIGAN_09182500 [Vigna angularis var. angularis]
MKPNCFQSLSYSTLSVFLTPFSKPISTYFTHKIGFHHHDQTLKSFPHSSRQNHTASSPGVQKLCVNIQMKAL